MHGFIVNLRTHLAETELATGVKAFGASLALCLTLAGPAAGEGPVTRDERVVKVDGVEETWRLEWIAAPELVCEPLDEGWPACPCTGFAFGEAGELDLVRLRDAREIDRLHLTPLFAQAEMPAGAEGHAVLQRWPVRDVDGDAFARANAVGRREFRKRVMERKLVPVLKLADFDHDGWATEFVLQVGSKPCGQRPSVVVGVSSKRPKLHVFDSADHPERPLVLEAEAWRQLSGAKGTIRFPESPCADVLLSADPRGIHAVRETFACGPSGAKQGEPVSREPL
jgi:hypothetical protein